MYRETHFLDRRAKHGGHMLYFQQIFMSEKLSYYGLVNSG